MEQTEHRAYYDPDLGVEAYFLKDVVKGFPTHFHEHYVIGTIESGERLALCHGEEFLIRPGDLVVFHPHEPHGCQQVGDYLLDWRCLNVKAEVMERTVEEITSRRYCPQFARNVWPQSELADLVREVFGRMERGERGLRCEEAFLLLLTQLLEDSEGALPPEHWEGDRAEIRAVCAYLEEHYAQSVALSDLAALAGLSKCHLLRSFTREKGISPYRYLETVRIGRAKELLERGERPVEVALQTGFSDQSHFSNFFRTLIGLTPRQYQEIFISGA